jgi:hypothetical protein
VLTVPPAIRHPNAWLALTRRSSKKGNGTTVTGWRAAQNSTLAGQYVASQNQQGSACLEPLSTVPAETA